MVVVSLRNVDLYARLSVVVDSRLDKLAISSVVSPNRFIDERRAGENFEWYVCDKAKIIRKDCVA